VLKFNRWIVWGCFFLSLSSVSVVAGNPLRKQMSLNGPWEYAATKASSLKLPDPQTSAWTQVTVPYTAGAPRAWFKKKISIPADWKDRRVELYFHGVGVHSVLYVNGRIAGENFLYVVPWVIDITTFITCGRENEILVGVENGNTCSGTGKRPWNVPGIWFTDGNISGLYYEAELRAHPPVFTENVFIRPSWREKMLTVSLTLRNTTDKPITAAIGNSVIDDKNIAQLAFDDTPVTLEPGTAKTITLEKEWKKPHGWFPHDPYLYHLKTDIRAEGKGIDELKTRFGFREFRIEKTSFYCNGVKAPMRRSSECLCYIRPDRENIRSLLSQIKSWGINVYRWHGLPAPEYLLDISDELGILITQEGDMWMDQGFYTLDDTLWNRFAEHWKRIVLLSRNHPSIFSYCVANESFNADKGVWQNPASEMYKRYHVINKLIRRLDPGTLVEYASGDDVCGDSSVHNWHYPNNLSARWQVPHNFYWLASNPHPGSTEKPGHRRKPVVIGEDYYDGFRGPNGAYAAIFGEDYYLAGPSYRQGPFFVQIKRIGSDIYRQIGIASINPADPAVKPWETNIIPPVGLLNKDFRQNFFANQKIDIGWSLANEEWFAQKVKVTWELRSENQTILLQQGSQDHDMPASEIKPITISLTMPKVADRTNYLLTTTVLVKGKKVDERTRQIHVFPPLDLQSPPGLRIGVFDPKRTFFKSLMKAGLNASVKPVAEMKPALLKNIDLLLIAPNIAQRLTVHSGDFKPFFDRGGSILVLEQKPSGFTFLEPGVEWDYTPQTIAFPSNYGHPILKGIEKDDIKWWSKDFWVGQGAFSVVKPRVGNIRFLVDSGDPVGLRWSPMLEIRHGKGRIVLSQLCLGGKFIEEPAARVILQNALNYFAQPVPHPLTAGLLAPENSPLAAALKIMKADYSLVNESNSNLAGYQVIIADGKTLALSPTLVKKVKAFVETGGKLLLKSVTPESVECLQVLAGIKPEVKPAKTYQCVRITRGPIVSGITQYDLWWRVGDWVANADGTTQLANPCRYPLANLAKAKVHIVAATEWVQTSANEQNPFTNKSIALAEMSLGKGTLYIDQIDWQESGAFQTGFKYASTLLNNLGIGFEAGFAPQVQKPLGSFYQISLKPFINQPLTAEVGGENTTGSGLNNLANVPSGQNIPFKDIPFTVAGLITMKSADHAPKYPEFVRGIPVDEKTKTLYFLHGAGWASPGEKVLTYRIHYKDKTSENVDIIVGTHVLDWWMPSTPLTGAVLAWEGRNEVQMPLSLYRVEWKNPKPNVKIETIDILTDSKCSFGFVLGITAETF
jgi:hypothetical protein